ncbi:MAG: PAC2 family protein [Candidatus Omnitrophica bacterium]|jgi:hypothetical protein|nr:PAC2 family protein [Candidatus Omnitrophota bacterium]
MDPVKIFKRPRLKKPYLIVAWPGMGDVAFRAATYLVEQLKAEEFAKIEASEFFYLTSSAIDAGILKMPDLPQSRFFFWKNKAGKNDLIIFLSNAQPDLSKAEEYSRAIINLAKSFHVQMVVSFASMPLTLEHIHASKVWFAATNSQLRETLKKNDFSLLNQGQISGMNGLFLSFAKKAGLEGCCLLGEIPLYTIQIENPKASAAVLAGLAKILGVAFDLAVLNQQAAAMEEEINKLLDFLKLGPPQAGAPAPIGDEEIELIKKSLSQLTKLPGSVKEKIENLFKQSQENIAKANELKVELDKWNVYKEYEDRFLDLFRKNRDKGN